MTRKKEIRNIYINIVLLLSFFLIVLFVLFKVIFTKGEFKPVYINDFAEDSSGVFNNQVVVDDKVRDYFYYKGQDYTTSANAMLPSGENRGLYGNNQLVYAKITYSALDLNNNLTAYVSQSERQNMYVYHKVYPIETNGTSTLSDDYITIELIENPFTDRPNDKGFNGWRTSYPLAKLAHDTNYFIRSVDVPVTYTNGVPDQITIDFNAVWAPANVSEVSTSRNWATALGTLDTAGMKALETYTTVDGPYDMTGYFEQVTLSRGESCTGLYDENGNYQSNCTCNVWWGTCTYYRRIENEDFDRDKTYYESRPRMTLVNNNSLPIPQISTYVNGFTANSNMATYYKSVLIPRYSSYEGYYNNLGQKQTSGTCNTNAGCVYYELINYYDSNGQPSLLDQNEDYYYLITRDLNILYMTSNLSNGWGNVAKPFTLTSLHNGSKRNVTWTTSFALRAYSDVNIENLRISSGANVSTGNPPTSTTTTRNFYGAWQNVRIGRGIERDASRTSWTAFVGGFSGTTGSTSNTTKYRVIIESGYYSSVTVGWTTGTSNLYLETRSIFGNDYDRVLKNNNNLLVHFVAAGSWGGTVRTLSDHDFAFDHIVKSGQFGSSKYDHTTGIYIGGRNQGTYYAARRIKIEGGWTYNVIGGPMSATNRTNNNDVYAYMVGGEVDAFFGGAGTSTTYGNRIVQITGGRVNYAVFGGSNSYNGASSDGLLQGSSFVYIGGTAEIGDPALVNSNASLWGAEAGSVFGIGNGRTGTSYTALGSMIHSNLIITDRALIHNNVYGGGNFGAVGISGTTTTNIWIYGGVVKGSIYGAGNNNGSGKSNVMSTVNIDMIDGEVEGSIYGGSNEQGTVFGSVNMNILGGTCYGTVYGGGRGGYTNSSNSGTYVRDAINIQVGSSESIPILVNGLYGGSAYGTVNSASQTLSLSSHKIDINIDNIQTSSSVFGGSKGSSTYSPNTNGHINITVNNGNIHNLFGGNDISGSVAGNTTINLNGGTINNVYGGGNQVSGNNSYITLTGATTGNIFGGSNQSGNMNSSTITLNSGEAESVFGGNNIGGKTTTTNIEVIGGDINYVYGGGRLANTGITNILLTSGSPANVYGGGESASIDTSTNITQNNSVLNNLFGGSNQSGTVPISNIEVNSGSINNLYGGNNAGGKTLVTDIEIKGGSLGNAYGGGKLANTNESFLRVLGGNLGNLYGGGEEADVEIRTNINISAGTVTTTYGGSNEDGLIPRSNLNITGGNLTTVYGGNNMGGSTIETDIIINSGNINRVFGGGNHADSAISNIRLNNNLGTIDYIYGGGNLANVTTTNLNIYGGKTNYIYGGSNQAGVVTSSNINIYNNPTVDTLYGGNNAGGITNLSNINSSGGTFSNIYGGGNQADTGSTNLYINNTTVNEEVYGGGKDGALAGDASTRVNNSTIHESLYSGGKGVTATVHGTTTLNIEGTTNIGQFVFGGGNAAATGTESVNNSSSVVNIAGATIGSNVYGGANTSVVYGTTEVNIGNITGLNNNKITINGTVFGGGEANASGSEVYDFYFISVTKGIDINIRNTATNNIDIHGSIFGSGNASSTTGISKIYIQNYGTKVAHKKNISIQRANLVTLDNSYIELFGATDRTNEYSNVLFSLSRIKELKLANNSTIYLETGTNLLEKFTSVVDHLNNVKAAVTIDGNSVVKNVDNRLYAKEGVNINVATNEAVTSYGVVSGMTFFGMYLRSGDGNTVEAFYDEKYDHGDTVSPGEFYYFSSGSYVLGSHVVNHDISVDGYYTNYEDEDNEGTVEVKYIDPIPEDSNYYMWVIGEAVASYDVDLIASLLSTFGSYELPLINSPDPNITFSIIGVNYTGLPGDFQLVDKNDIPRISAAGTADTVMALTMRSSRTGWITSGETVFLTSEAEVLGTKDYVSENSAIVPSLLFNLYHSRNISQAGNIGTIVVQLTAIKPIDDLNNEVTRVNVNINLSKALYSSNEYEGAMTSGEEHTIFASTKTDITDKSKLSAYYSLFIDDTDNIYKTGYHRSLISSFVLPEGTKITMIDFHTANPTYYYYIINAQDVIAANAEFAIHNEASYKVSKFIEMGSISANNNYDDAYYNTQYYNSNLRIVSEEFIFIVDYADTNNSQTRMDASLTFELRNAEEGTVTSVLGITYSNLSYNLYAESDALIALTANLSENNIYLRDSTRLNLTTNFQQPQVNGVTVRDTSFYDKKLGIKISIFDENDNQLTGASLLGITFTLNGITYYPRMDGTTRINIAPTIANISSSIIVNTSDSNLSSGAYTIQIDSFGSADGIYYGLTPSDTKEVTLHLLNNIYGLKSSLGNNLVNIDYQTGNTMNGNNVLLFNIDYESGLANPNLRVSLARRKYNTVHSLEYEKVDFSDYFTHSYSSIGAEEEQEYLLTNNLFANQQYYLYLKDNLVTGTYKVLFSLYDGDNFIGEVYNYIVIR